MSLHRADAIMPSSKSRFIVSEVKKANTVSVNNFNKIKNMFTFFVGNINKQHATDSILIVHLAQILTPLYRVK